VNRYLNEIRLYLKLIKICLNKKNKHCQDAPIWKIFERHDLKNKKVSKINDEILFDFLSPFSCLKIQPNLKFR
jgi:hypothetical protein